MEKVTLKSDICCDALVIPGNVIDRMIKDANEAQLKIYLYLLRMGSDSNITISTLADYFNYTEADVIRALRFWNGTEEKKEEIPSKEVSVKKVESAKSTQGDNVVAFSGKPSYSKEKLQKFAKDPEISQLLFAAELYMARPLTSDDIALYLYIHEEMGFSAQLIEYLLEYCISNNKKSARNIESVACEWQELKVESVEDAKRLNRQIPSVMPKVFEAFGLDKNRQPMDQEITYVRRWTESYGYGMDIIREACQRTVMSTGKPSFRYANSILKGWHEAKVVTLADIVENDEQYRSSKVNEVSPAKAAARPKKSDNSGSAGITNNKFRNFNEREYDYDSLMKDILSN